MENNIQKEPGMASQAIYQITAKGKLDEQWGDWFNGATIQIDGNPEGNHHTILTCLVRDQAELLGILNRLNSLNLPLLHMTLMEEEQ
jgi:hypothetical protein